MTGTRLFRPALVWSLLVLALLPRRAEAQGAAQLPAGPAGSILAAEQGAGADEPVRPGDVVRLTVWRHPDLTDEFPVNQYGTVVLPKLGEIDVTRETHRSLRERVIGALRETVVSPSIEIVVLKRVRVLGEVQRPGVLFVDPTMTVADALALAGGTTSQGRQGNVILRRDGTALLANLQIDTRISDARIRSGDELVVPQRNWLDRNSGALIGASVGFVGILVALLTR